MSVMILPPERNALRPTALTLLEKIRLTVWIRLLKNVLFHIRAVGSENQRIGSYHVFIHAPHLLKVALWQRFVHSICVLKTSASPFIHTTFKWDSISLNFMRSPSVVKISIRITWNVPSSTGM
jgi:hypothetical protein